MAQNEGFVATHTLLVIWRAVKFLPDLYAELSASEQNIIWWTTLLHDIRKLGTPIIEGKDHCHPFKGAAAVLDVFRLLGILDCSTKHRQHLFDQVCRLLSESVQPLPRKQLAEISHGKCCMTTMHSHHNLAQIFYLLWEEKLAPRG